MMRRRFFRRDPNDVRRAEAAERTALAAVDTRDREEAFIVAADAWEVAGNAGRAAIMNALRPSRSSRRYGFIQRLARRVVDARSPEAAHDAAVMLADAAALFGMSNRISTGRRGPVQRWEVSELEVWGNAQDGFDINNAFRAGVLEVPTEEVVHIYRSAPLGFERRFETNDRALERAVRANYLAPGARVTMDDFGDGYIRVEARATGEPLYDLHLLEDV